MDLKNSVIFEVQLVGLVVHSSATERSYDMCSSIIDIADVACEKDLANFIIFVYNDSLYENSYF